MTDGSGGGIPRYVAASLNGHTRGWTECGLGMEIARMCAVA